MSLLNTEFGVIRPAPNLAFVRGMSLAAIDALALPRGRDFDFDNGSTALGVGYLPYGKQQIYYSLKLHLGLLYAVAFGLKYPSNAPPFEFDAQLQQAHVSFLREELGPAAVPLADGVSVSYRYGWGTVGAFWDAKGGQSSMMLSWS